MNFVDNSLALPPSKADINPLTVPANNGLDAADFNALEQACYDLRTVIERQVSLASYGADPTGTLDNSASFNAAVAALGSAGGTINIPGISAGTKGVYLLSANVTTPAKVVLNFQNAVVSIASGFRLTIGGAVAAPPVQIFNCMAVTPSFATPQVLFSGPQTEINVLWFGADATGAADSTNAIQNAVISSGEYAIVGTSGTMLSLPLVRFPPGSFMTSAAIAFNFYCNIRGENTILSGPISPSINLFSGLGAQTRIRGMTFYQGNHALAFSCALSGASAVINDCQFFSQQGAAVYTDTTCQNLACWVTDCWFSTYYETGGGVVICNSGAVTLTNCYGETGSSTVFTVASAANYGSALTLNNVSLAPTTAGGQWFSATGNGPVAIQCRECRFGGEAIKPFCSWNVIPTPADINTQSGNLSENVLSVDGCAIESVDGIFITFLSIPNKLRLTNNTGNQFSSGLYFAPGIPNDQVQQIQYLFTQDAPINLVNFVANNSAQEVTDRLYAKQTQAQRFMPVSDMTLGFDAGTSSYGATNGVPTAVTVSSPSTDPYGCTGIKWLSTNNSSYVSRVYATALAGLAAGPYSLIIDFNSSSVDGGVGAPVEVTFYVGGRISVALIPSGQSTLSIPFYKSYADPSTWIAGTVYNTVGARVLSTNGSDIWQVITPGTALGSGNGPINGLSGYTFVDNTVVWEWVGALNIGLACENLLGGSQLSFSRVRVLANHHECDTQNTVVYGTSVPGSGQWFVGDIVYNTAPTASGGGSPQIGWVCVAAGTPGTWKTFGATGA